MEFRGNRWYKCDLHLHTPESNCFPNKNVTSKEWVKACLDKQLEVVAVTDHNSGNGISETSYQTMQSFLDKPYINGYSSDTNLTVNHKFA